MKRATCSNCVIILLIILTFFEIGGNIESFAEEILVLISGRVEYESYSRLNDATVKFISSAGDTTSAKTDLIGNYELYLSLPTTHVKESFLPEDFILYPNYPNPFNPGTTIEYELKRSAQVKLFIYNISGQLVRRLKEGYESPGMKRIRWDGRDDDGMGVAAGVYLYHFQADDFIRTKKMLLLDGGSSWPTLPAKKPLSTSALNNMKQLSSQNLSQAQYDICVERKYFKRYYEEGFTVPEGVSEVRKHFKLNALHDYYIDTNFYIIIPNEKIIQSYAGGGGTYILSMTPKNDFEGEIQLSVTADSLLNVRLWTPVLSLENKVTEVSIRPDTSAERGVNAVTIVSTNQATIDTLMLFINMESPVEVGENSRALHSEFIEWININFPELEISHETEWFSYIPSAGLVGAYERAFENEKWEMRFIAPSARPFPTKMYVRPRCEAEPILAAERGEDGSIRGIPVEDYWNW